MSSKKLAVAVACSILTVLAVRSAEAGTIGLIRTLNRPIVPAAGQNSTFHSRHAFNPSVVLFKGTYYLYFRGEDGGGAQAVGVWTAAAASFDGVSWNENPVSQPVLTDGSLVDPCAVVFNDQVYLYYMGNDGQPYLATSSDGLNFTKRGHLQTNGGQPLGGGTPAAFVNSNNGQLYLFVSYGNGNGNGYQYMVTSSSDGFHFATPTAAITPSYVPNAIDAQSISTIRIYQEGSYYYAIYGASSTHDDYNEGLGLARSTDLVNWTKYPKNPILLRGPAGSGDEAAVWSGSLIKAKNTYYLYYEGAGSGAGANTPASNKARSEQYGGWAATNFSQIWLATSSSIDLGDWSDDGGLSPSTTYSIANASGNLDVNGGPDNNGARIFLNGSAGSPGQAWQFTNTDGLELISSANGILPGYQALEMAGQAITNGAGVDQWPSWGGANQQWQAVPTGNGLYAFKNRNSGKVLDSGSGNVTQADWNASSGQQWSLSSRGSNGVNYVNNPGIEATGPSSPALGWSVWSGNNTANASYTEYGSHTGNLRMTNASGSPFQVYTYQNLFGIPNGTYTLSAWVTGGGGQSASFLSAKDFGGSELTQDVIPFEANWPNWKCVSLPNIIVTNHKITLGVYTSDPNGGSWVSFDDFQLTPQ